MSRTRADIQFKALAIITGGDVGQIPSAEDAAALDKYIDDVCEELAAKNVVYIPDPNTLEGSLFTSITQLVANAAADEFGGTSDPQKKAYYEGELRVISAQIPGYGPIKAEWF